MSTLRLIIGGARSGKSSLAERYAKSSNFSVTYIATAQAFDTEMQQRIEQHQSDRPEHWQLIESPLLLAQTIELAILDGKSVNKNKVNQGDTKGICILVDCLTLWLTNCLCKPSVNAENSSGCNLTYWKEEHKQLLALLEKIQHKDNAEQYPNVKLILVSNEVGHGIVPMGELSRQFVDQAGWLHQAIAHIADHVEFVMAGIPLTLKSPTSAV